jgi:hypothetical protein
MVDALVDGTGWCMVDAHLWYRLLKVVWCRLIGTCLQQYIWYSDSVDNGLQVNWYMFIYLTVIV